MNARRTAPPAVLLAASAALYWPTTRTFFVGDDFWWLHVATTVMTRPAGWLSILLHANGMGTYRPLTENVYFWLCWHLFGPVPLGFHLIALTTFLATVYVVWRIAERLSGDPVTALGAAALFAGCTAMFEMLDWAAAFSEAGAVACMALAALAFLSGRQAAASAWAALALLCNETAISLPLMLLAYAFLTAPQPIQPAMRRALRESAGPLLALAGYVLARMTFIGLHPSGAFSPVWSPQIWATLTWRALLWSLDVSGPLRNVIAAWHPTVLVPLAALGLAATLLCTQRPTTDGIRLIAIGVLWWLLGLLPTLPIAHDFSPYNIAGALLGCPLILVGIAKGSSANSRVAVPALGVTFLILGALTVYGPGGLAQIDGVTVLARQARAAWVQMSAVSRTRRAATFCAPANASWTLNGPWESGLADPGSRVQYGPCGLGSIPLHLRPAHKAG